MSRKPEARIDDIIACCEKVLRFTSGMNREQLFEQDLVMDAVLRNIQIIGEAAKHIPDDVRARIPGIEWKKITGMRDWIAHVHYRVDDEIVWNVVEKEVPELLRALQRFKDEDQP